MIYNDTIIFKGIQFNELEFNQQQGYGSGESGSLVIYAKEGGYGQIHINNFFDPSGKNAIETFIFDDQTIQINTPEFEKLFDTTYVIEKEFGYQTINDSRGNDTIIFKGIQFNEVEFGSMGYGQSYLSISAKNSSYSQIYIDNFFDSSDKNAIKTFVFEDQTIMANQIERVEGEYGSAEVVIKSLDSMIQAMASFGAQSLGQDLNTDTDDTLLQSLITTSR